MSMGFVLVNKMRDGGVNQVSGMDDQLRKQIENSMLAEGEPIMIPIFQKTAERGDVVQFGVGVLNLLNENAVEFQIYPEYVDAVHLETGDKLSDLTGVLSEQLPVVLDGFDIETIKNNDIHVFPVNIDIPKDVLSGYEYVFNVIINDENDDPYPSENDLRKLYVKVP